MELKNFKKNPRVIGGIVLLVVLVLIIYFYSRPKNGNEVSQILYLVENNKRSEKKKVENFCKKINGKKLSDFERSMRKSIQKIKRVCDKGPQDCRGEWSDWSACEGQCVPSKRTYKVKKEGNVLGQECEKSNGFIERKRCNNTNCEYDIIARGSLKGTSKIGSEDNSNYKDCKEKCDKNEKCDIFILTNGNMCEYHSIPDYLEPITFEYSEKIDSYMKSKKHDFVKNVTPPIIPGEEQKNIMVAPGGSMDKTFTKVDGFNLVAGEVEDISSVSVENGDLINECTEKCKGDSKCNLFTADKEGKVCYLKSVVNDNVTIYKDLTKDVYHAQINV